MAPADTPEVRGVAPRSLAADTPEARSRRCVALGRTGAKKVAPKKVAEDLEWHPRGPLHSGLVVRVADAVVTSAWPSGSGKRAA